MNLQTVAAVDNESDLILLPSFSPSQLQDAADACYGEAGGHPRLTDGLTGWPSCKCRQPWYCYLCLLYVCRNVIHNHCTEGSSLKRSRHWGTDFGLVCHLHIESVLCSREWMSGMCIDETFRWHFQIHLCHLKLVHTLPSHDREGSITWQAARGSRSYSSKEVSRKSALRWAGSQTKSFKGYSKRSRSDVNHSLNIWMTQLFRANEWIYSLCPRRIGRLNHSFVSIEQSEWMIFTQICVPDEMNE